MNKPFKNVHLIAIGGAVMSSLAIALKHKAITVTGSDDNIYDPAKSNLSKENLLPKENGWFADRISSDVDAVILGMHAKGDNPELRKAREMNIPVFSYPDFIRSLSEKKQRIVICGSHGKTTITGMIIHVLNYFNRSFDFVIGAKVNGMDETIRLSDAPIIVIEGDEYFTSTIDPHPKFLKYAHHIALISGISWDHVNVYETLESYHHQFEKLADSTPKAGTLVFCEEDMAVAKIGDLEREDSKSLPYNTPNYTVKDGCYYLVDGDHKYPLKIFGKHNMQNIGGAKIVLKRIGITAEQFYQAIQSFEGTYNRGNLIGENASVAVYSDFAHAPSKLQATVNAMKELHPTRQLTACFELHTFSSLNKAYLPQYKDRFESADHAIVFFDENLAEAIRQPADEPIAESDIRAAFNRDDIVVFNSAQALDQYLTSKTWQDEDLIFMSSGNFGGLDIEKIASKIVS